MERCYLLEKLPDGQFTLPCPENMLHDAHHVRPGFRVLRRLATRVEFILSDGTGRHTDDNYGTNYIVDGIPGRYVVEHSIRRVGDADVDACVQTVTRSTDRYIHLAFRADLWEACYASFQRNGAKEWTTPPGELMTRVQRPVTIGKSTSQERRFELIIEATSLAVAFNNGDDVWDSNNGHNYHIGFPGKYVIIDGRATYKGPSDMDVQINPKGTPRAVARAPPPKTTPTSVAAGGNDMPLGDMKRSEPAVQAAQ